MHLFSKLTQLNFFLKKEFLSKQQEFLSKKAMPMSTRPVPLHILVVNVSLKLILCLQKVKKFTKVGDSTVKLSSAYPPSFSGKSICMGSIGFYKSIWTTISNEFACQEWCCIGNWPSITFICENKFFCMCQQQKMSPAQGFEAKSKTDISFGNRWLDKVL